MRWEFATHTKSLDIIGFKDNDIEKFGQDPVKSLVREAIQNSCDALDVNNQERKVKVVIRKGRVMKNELPNFSKIEQHIRACDDQENDKAENAEVQRHIKAFEQHQYTFLEIADYNTTGMDSKRLESFARAMFKSSKGAGSQGSKGVGKAAYYASSYLRTMLISTRNHEGIRYSGSSKIGTHTNPDDPSGKLNYKGFYGDLELKNKDEVPPLFWRSEKGTSVFIIGLWNGEKLEQNIIKEVLRNYWFAIYKDELEVEVGGTVVSSTNVWELVKENFKDYKDYKTGDRQNPRPYLETVLHGDLFEKNIKHIGICKLWLYKNENFSLGAVARFRKSKMLIFKEKDIDVGYAGVFLCENEEGNIFLKEIENDAHDIWSEKINPDYKDRAREALQGIQVFIRESYERYADIRLGEKFRVASLDEMFNFAGANIGGGKKKIPKVTKAVPLDEREKDQIIVTAKFKSYVVNNKIYYRLEFTSLQTKKRQQFKVSIGTDSSKDMITILKADGCSYKDNILTMDIQKGVNVVEKIQLDSPFLVAPSLTSITDTKQ